MNEWIIFGGIVLVSAVIVGWRGMLEQKKQRALAEKLIREEYGTVPGKERRREEAAIKGSYLHDRKNAGQFFLDDITWNDLDMDLMFQRMNYARSSAGAGELYRMLRCPVTEREVLRERDTLAGCMQEKSDLREQLSMALYEIGFTGKYALEDYLDYLDNLGKRDNIRHILMDLLYIPAVGLLFTEPALGILLLFVVLVANIMTYFKEKGEANPYLISFAYILRMIKGAEKIKGILNRACRSGSLKADSAEAEAVFEKYQDILEKDVKALGDFRSFSQMAMSMSNPMGSSGPLDLLFDYLKMALHLDLIKFNQMLKIVREKDALIRELVSAVGTLDACISIAYFRASLDGFCRPDIREEYGLSAEELYHPLLHDPVKNSIDTKRGVLVTGSNASGKSTFLKTVALGAVFAQTICTVPAKRWSAPFYRVMSSMALRDDLTGGESYFMVEIRALKRILDACGENEETGAGIYSGQEAAGGDRGGKMGYAGGQRLPAVLCFVDEVLRGTNTVERIAASSRILQSLTGKGVLCFAATHDIELTHLLEGAYENYHFEETIEDGDISFNYLLKKGRAQSRNAIRLLEVMGYDARVIREAEELAERFLETGEWLANGIEDDIAMGKGMVI